ncbi:MAG TPA: GIY-YIG nuclease family protein [Bacillus sp. (in: firmicutes)]|uniref:GIY-YIG nuclease family protein n=1 Tax=Bacillus litorisediminis TaxID=2922713 RepID=UPI001FAF7E48|nr:GIY-YIG nuclease family protein [Bacillus litorisediminis]HWO74368.1 GIY-YIG nuclease family protein [Bacillus sp. (in: firmicutes)]
MVKHFGVNIREKSDGLKLTRDNYIKVNNRSSFKKGKVYSDSYINKHIEDCLYNYDLNVEYFRLLPKQEFNKELMRFVSKTKLFKEITDLVSLNEVPGYYIMVLDEYSQAYIGRSTNIKNRIQSHWNKQKEFDRLIFGSKEKSILSIDSFKALDTTRIFVYPTDELEEHEDNFINLFDNKYLLNRTKGGTLVGLIEAIINRKTRDLSI